MNAKNRFKNDVMKVAMTLNIKGNVARKEIDTTFQVFENGDGNSQYGCVVGDYSFGGCEFGSLSYWLTNSNDGTIESTESVVHVK